VAFEGWEKLPDGSIKLYPLVGIETFRPYGMVCGVRVQYVGSDAELQAGAAKAVPLVMTTAQARDLARALTKLADVVEAPSGETPQ
jgi:MinD-like ATPase involved in chromosome partitioning or flagellar assembly